MKRASNLTKVLVALLSLLMTVFAFTACGGEPDNGGNKDSTGSSESVGSTDSSNEGDSDSTGSGDELPVRTGITGLSFTNEVTALEGNWKISKVYAGGKTTDAVADSISFNIKLELDPSELVDGPAYIHNQVYNLTGNITYGIAAVKDQLTADDVETFKGTAMWDAFVLGEVVEEGQFYKQNGPTIMNFRDVDDYGLFLDQVAGVAASINTKNKILILGMNNDGQLLLGYSSVHLERPNVTGDWEYCLIFQKA